MCVRRQAVYTAKLQFFLKKPVIALRKNGAYISGLSGLERKGRCSKASMPAIHLGFSGMPFAAAGSNPAITVRPTLLVWPVEALIMRCSRVRLPRPMRVTAVHTSSLLAEIRRRYEVAVNVHHYHVDIAERVVYRGVDGGEIVYFGQVMKVK